MIRPLAAAALLAVSLAGPSIAAPITLTFSVSGFDPSNGNAAPADPVTGTIMWEAASATAPAATQTPPLMATPNSPT